MTPTSNDVGRRSLFARLTGLDIPTPPRLLDLVPLAAPGVPRARLRHRRIRRAVVALGVSAVLVVGNGVAAYFVPNYAHALAAVPVLSLITGPALSAAGLSAGDIKPLHDEGSWSGVTVTLSGSYADGLQTVLFVDIEGLPAGGPGRPSPTFGLGQIVVTDQFGQSYRLVGGEGLGVGPYPMIFEPLRGAAARVGGRLTLHVPFTKRGGASGALTQIDLHAAVVAGSDHRLAVPAPQAVAGTTYSIADLEASSNSLEVHTLIRGASIDANLAARPAIGQGVCYPGVFLVSPSGTYEIPTASLGDPFGRLKTDHVDEETRVFALSQTGTYRIVATGTGCTGNPPQADPVVAEWSITIGG
ncbi:MAG: hypothetical protein JF887_07785 [Candidatus Dormibacteraeota bacterium]|uniref:DUF4179 domain-containing protein n=1 Tax=Candidatus Amunia macphersoniae TaxID=3127014 RepID=A0A934KM22_9BACT|nr:hypothetical protein [Candidatus Dormibacteraeota bacterium]